MRWLRLRYWAWWYGRYYRPRVCPHCFEPNPKPVHLSMGLTILVGMRCRVCQAREWICRVV